MELYVTCQCGLRTTAKILSVLNRVYKWQLADIPSPNSIANWIQKSGYGIYKETGSADFPEGYATIIDESMLVGSEKLLLTVGIPASKRGNKSLTEGEARVLDISVKTSWNSARIGAVFEQVEEKMRSSPAYVVSDNASTINKAVRDRAYTHLRDVGHTLGLFVQQVYEKESDFQSFMKAVNRVKFREVMRSTAYLLPPKQRTIARFMNLSTTIKWAVAMLNAFSRLNTEEQEVFHFINKYTSIIHEMQEVFRVVNSVLQQLKNEGLSATSIPECLSKIKSLLLSSNPRIAAVGRLIEGYIRTEKSKLSNKQARWHISSDIIESLFGSYKARKSPNAMHGVTKQIFLLPLLTQMNRETRMDNGCFKFYMERVFLKDLDTWRNNYLSENRTVKRRHLLCA